MTPYIVKFNHLDDDMTGNGEEVFLCIHASDRRDAAEKFWSITGGESRGNFLVSVTGEDKIEAFWLSRDWKFVTIPVD